MTRKIVQPLVVLVVALGSVLAFLWIVQRRLIYLPHPRGVPPAATVLAGAEEVVLPTEDGLMLRGWFLPGRGEGRRPAAAVFNGNAGNRSHRAPLAAALAREGLSVLLLDYRGFAENPGRPTEEGLAADARAARGYLRSRGDVDPARLVYVGESLGAAVAVRLSEEEPPAALVLRSPFTSLADVARVHYPFLPVRLLLRDRYLSSERIRNVPSPVLVLAAEMDRVVPARQSRRLYEAAPGPKRLVVVPGAGHNDPGMLDGPVVVGAIVDFLSEHGGLPD